MRYFHFTKKFVSIVLLMIIFTTTIIYAVTDADIDVLYDVVISGAESTAFMNTLYETGLTLEEPLSNDEINTRLKKFITFVMNESQRRVDNGEINKTNYRDEIQGICKQKMFDAKLDQLFITAYPELGLSQIIDGIPLEVPKEMEPMYHSLANASYTQLGLKNSSTSTPAPTTTTSPTQTPTPTPTIKPTTAPPTGGGGTGSGGTTTPIAPPILPPSKIFNDLQGVEWAENAVNTLAEAGVISKNYEMKFEPLNNVKREEFVKLIVSGFNLKNPNAKSDFTDVDKDSWFYPYVSSMAMLNLVKGFNNSFGTGQDITRQDIAALLYRVMQYVGIDATPSEPELFNDDAQISDYAKNSVYIMRQMGIIKGTPENTFEPTSFATRAEAAQMIYNTYKIYIAKK